MKSFTTFSWSLPAWVILLFSMLSCQKNIIAENPQLSIPKMSSVNTALVSGENAAPSEHLHFYFPSDAIAKIHKIKITQSAYA